MTNQRTRIVVSSDAATRLKSALEWIKSYPVDTQLLIVAPSMEAASELHFRVVSATGSWFGIQRLTLNGLASRLAQQTLASAGAAPATSLSLTALAARVIHLLQSDGQLSYFEPVATRPG